MMETINFQLGTAVNFVAALGTTPPPPLHSRQVPLPGPSSPPPTGYQSPGWQVPVVGRWPR